MYSLFRAQGIRDVDYQGKSRAKTGTLFLGKCNLLSARFNCEISRTICFLPLFADQPPPPKEMSLT